MLSAQLKATVQMTYRGVEIPPRFSGGRGEHVRRANKDAISGATAATFPQQQQEDRDSLDTRVSTLKELHKFTQNNRFELCLLCLCTAELKAGCVCVCVCVWNRATGTVEK